MRKSRILLIILCLMAAIFGFAACDVTPADSGMHKITYSLNYAGAPEATYESVADGETATEPAAPTRTGFAFRGWYRDYMGVKEYDFSEPVKENLRLFAKWGLTTATVTFEYRNGQESTSVHVSVGEKVSRPSDPARDNYRFTGWFTNAACTEEYDFNSEVDDNLTLYAGWKQLAATVTFRLYGDKTETATVEVGETVDEPQRPEREDYEFTGWFTDSAGRNEYHFETPVTGDFTLYAGWKLVRATITLDGNYEGSVAQTVKADVGSTLQQPAAPERTGHNFTGWYIDSLCTSRYNFGDTVTENFTLYAGWELATYTVTFSDNYPGGAQTEKQVKYNEQVTGPDDDPQRTGYTFTGWFEDEDCTRNFDFNAPITGDTTVYAGWQAESQSGELTIRFLLNDGTDAVYETDTVRSGRRISEPKQDPEKKGYFFAGWAIDAAGTRMYDFTNGRATASMDLYAKWLKGYTFEAEYTYVEGKKGQGSSDNCEGTDIIQSVADVPENGAQMGMSNGYYVGKLYYNGAYLDFEITSSAEVTDAVLVLRLTPDLYDMHFTDETWQVLVNGERIPYGNLDLTGAYPQTWTDENGNIINGDMNKRPFENYIITMSLHLVKGENTIRLLTNNREDHGGTFNAHTPLIDCMYIYSSAELSWTHCYPENVGKSSSDVNYDITYDTKRRS